MRRILVTVVVLGEGAMVTAQVNRRVPYGMNTGDNGNRQFVLSVMHWLSRRLQIMTLGSCGFRPKGFV